MMEKIISEELNRIRNLMGLLFENEEESNTLKINYTSTEKRDKGKNYSIIVVKGVSLEDKILLQQNPNKEIILVKNGVETNIGINPFRIKNIDWDIYLMNNNGRYNSLVTSGKNFISMIRYDKSKNSYQKTLRNLLRDIYTNEVNENGEPLYGESVKDENCRTKRGVINIKGVKYGKDLSMISEWSILNYFDTNMGVLTRLVKLYNTENNTSLENETDSFEGAKIKFLNWLENNSERILGPESTYLDELETLAWGSMKVGISNEQNAINVLKTIHNIDEGGITEYCPGSVEDTMFGRDLKINDENIYYQIKPLKGKPKESTSENFKYSVPTGVMKKYNPKYVDRIMFINSDGSKYLIFKNENYQISSKGDYVMFMEKPLYEK